MKSRSYLSGYKPSPIKVDPTEHLKLFPSCDPEPERRKILYALERHYEEHRAARDKDATMIRADHERLQACTSLRGAWKRK